MVLNLIQYFKQWISTANWSAYMIIAIVMGDTKIRTINPKIQSGSTVLFECYEDMQLSHQGQYSGVTYGTGGLSTQKAFEKAMCSLENGHSSHAFSSGINAIINTLMAFTRSGDEVLIVDNVYGPTARFCQKNSYQVQH